MQQSPEALARVGGACDGTASLLLNARDMMTEALRSDLRMRRIDAADPALHRYLIMSMGSLPDETMRILFLDGNNRLISDEQLQRGTLAALTLYPRILFRRALEHNAAGVLLVHNHPSGNAEPSRQDIASTRQLARIGHTLEVEVVDHIIVTRKKIHHIIWRDEGDRASRKTGWTLRCDPWGEEADIARALDNALRTMRRRLLRRQLIGSDELFGEPAWDLLIDLFVQEYRGINLPTSSLGIATDASLSSATRLVRRLCEAGLIARVQDPGDGRRTFVRLTPQTLHKMRAYFAEAPDSEG
ncbi:JAB domain-containing protein [Sphingopyxis sp.]|uniref:JAB domain-containing protein n=1 Tax=Sphingopyxis sp. TaxID=1908224 RepID=UPI002D791323|nr:JAB domain-containing protein [Sphingopyxis sp.]HET6523573.1 JAB domain-containing protein [Sphingopyxis sp.]